MPRRSLAALTTRPVATRTLPSRLRVPSGLSPTEREVWAAITAGLPGDWFQWQGDLLERYSRHVARARTLEALIAATDPASDLDRFRKLAQLVGDETRTILALARSMRLTAQSRQNPTTAYRRAAGGPPVRDIHDPVALHTCSSKASQGGGPLEPWISCRTARDEIFMSSK